MTDSTGTASCEEDTASADYIRISSTCHVAVASARGRQSSSSRSSRRRTARSRRTGARSRSRSGEVKVSRFPGIQLSGTGPGSFSGTTSENGCVIFGNLPVGNYTLTVNLPGYVNQGRPACRNRQHERCRHVDQHPRPPVRRARWSRCLVHHEEERAARPVECRVDRGLQHRHDRGQGVLEGNAGSHVERRASVPVRLARPPSSRGGARRTTRTPDDVVGAPGAAAQASVHVLPDQIAAAQIQLPSLDLRVRSGTSASSPGTPVSAATVILTDSGCAAARPDRKDQADYGHERRADRSRPSMEHVFNVCVGKSGKSVDHLERPAQESQCIDGLDRLPRRRGHRDLHMTPALKDEGGYSLIELVIAASAGVMVLLGLFAMFDLSVKNSAQVTQRVDANGRAKPAIQQLMNDLHSACTGPEHRAGPDGEHKHRASVSDGDGQFGRADPRKARGRVSGRQPDRADLPRDRRGQSSLDLQREPIVDADPSRRRQRPRSGQWPSLLLLRLAGRRNADDAAFPCR